MCMRRMSACRSIRRFSQYSRGFEHSDMLGILLILYFHCLVLECKMTLEKSEICADLTRVIGHGLPVVYVPMYRTVTVQI